MAIMQEMGGDKSRFGPRWGNLDVPIAQWRGPKEGTWSQHDSIMHARDYGKGVWAVGHGRMPSVVLLHNCSLQGPLSPQLCRLSSLTALFLNSNQITVVPEGIGNLSSLIELSLSSNQITTVPDAIGRLTNLAILEMRTNQIAVVPDAIGRLSNLKELDFYANQITAFPNTIGNLSNLTRLSLSANRISTVPDAISSLSNLTELDLRWNSLTEEELKRIQAIKKRCFSRCTTFDV